MAILTLLPVPAFCTRVFVVPHCFRFALALLLGAAAISRAAQPAPLTLTPRADGAIELRTGDGATAIFAPEFLLQHSVANPNLEMRWGKFQDPALRQIDTGSVYNVLTWGRAAGGAAAAGHVEDGFDPAADRGYGAGRTADFFQAAPSARLRGTDLKREGNRVTWQFPAHPWAEVKAELDLPADGSPARLRLRATARRDGWFSFGYVGAPATPHRDVQELWQPLIWNERRLPEGSFLEAAYRCPVPATLVTRGGTTIGVGADPAEYAFQPLPNFQNSRFGVALRNQRGEAQPMLFAPILGGAGSQMKTGDTREFTFRLFVANAGLSASFERIARELFGFADIRHNALGSLNATFERMRAFGVSEYAKFNSELRGFAYDTDVPGAVKNVSALHPLGIALATDGAEIFTRLARPLMEYFVSRERFLFTTDPKVKGQSASARLGGLGAPLTEYANLYAISGRRTPFFRTAAESLFGQDRVLNLEGKIRGDNWSNALALYRATGERRWLEAAVRDADNYLRTRGNMKAADFSDPDSRGLFFWTAWVPQWIELFELYEETKERRYLEAAHAAARGYAQFVWLSPKIPGGEINVHRGGLAPAYRSGPRFPRIKLAEETVPAWRASEIGLTSESAPTSKGARGIFLACYAPWMLRIAALTGDAFLHDIARSAIIGRYTSFPGYHLNTERNAAYEKPDFARRGKDELNSATSIHYNHIWPHIALLLDYLVSDAFAKSKGAVDFPGRYAEGYGYLQQRIYGDRPGHVHDARDLWLWMPAGVVDVEHPELNYITARGDGTFAIVLTNQSQAPVRSRVSVNPAFVKLPAAGGVTVDGWTNGRRTSRGKLDSAGVLNVDVPAAGIVALIVRGVAPQPQFQATFLAPAKPLPAGSVSELGFRGAKAVAMRFGGGRGMTSVYAYLPDFEREIARCRLNWRQAGRTGATDDTTFPFDFTVIPADATPLEYWVEVHLKDGRAEKSPVGRVELE